MSGCCRCCEAAAQRGELDHALSATECPCPSCDYCQGGIGLPGLLGRVGAAQPGQMVTVDGIPVGVVPTERRLRGAR